MVNKINWCPSATLNNLKKRAEIMDKIRHFFKSRDVMEVETPLLCHATITDLHIQSIKTLDFSSQSKQAASPNYLYLQTSPEFSMKRLLAAGCNSIFQITKAFRAEPCTQKHNPEFTLLEWYRLGFTHHDLMNEMDLLIQEILNTPKAKRISYHDLFQEHLNINPHQTTIEELKNCAALHHIVFHQENRDLVQLNIDDWLNILLTHLLEPKLQEPTFLYGYPITQAALAKIEHGVAARFEFYIRGLELANGFYELADGQEQRKRIENDLLARRTYQLHEPTVDQRFLAALDNGLPDCSGVALGVDRLIMLALDETDIKHVLSFDFERA